MNYYSTPVFEPACFQIRIVSLMCRLIIYLSVKSICLDTIFAPHWINGY